jgi:hypothetical protein
MPQTKQDIGKYMAKSSVKLKNNCSFIISGDAVAFTITLTAIGSPSAFNWISIDQDDVPYYADIVPNTGHIHTELSTTATSSDLTEDVVNEEGNPVTGKDYLDIVSVTAFMQGTDLIFTMHVNGDIPSTPVVPSRRAIMVQFLLRHADWKRRL